MQDTRFPFRIAIAQAGRILFSFHAMAPWPGVGTRVFCLREQEHDPGEPRETVKRA